MKKREREIILEHHDTNNKMTFFVCALNFLGSINTGMFVQARECGG
jgi:hypothetical protein